MAFLFLVTQYFPVLSLFFVIVEKRRGHKGRAPIPRTLIGSPHAVFTAQVIYQHHQQDILPRTHLFQVTSWHFFVGYIGGVYGITSGVQNLSV